MENKTLNETVITFNVNTNSIILLINKAGNHYPLEVKPLNPIYSDLMEIYSKDEIDLHAFNLANNNYKNSSGVLTAIKFIKDTLKLGLRDAKDYYETHIKNKIDISTFHCSVYRNTMQDCKWRKENNNACLTCQYLVKSK